MKKAKFFIKDTLNKIMEIDVKQKVLEEMRNPDIYIKDVVDYIEKHVKYVIGVACAENLDINTWKPDDDFGIQIGQKTVFLTARMFDLWEDAVVKVLTKRLKRFGVRVEHNHTPHADLVITFPNKEKIFWEIKSSQAKNGWTGATHSSSKTSNYILINYSVDRSKKLNLEDNPKFITRLCVLVWDDMDAKWSGKPTSRNSFTSLKIPKDIKEKRPEIIVVGDLIPKQKWCDIERKKLN